MTVDALDFSAGPSRLIAEPGPSRMLNEGRKDQPLVLAFRGELIAAEACMGSSCATTGFTAAVRQ
jgi:hypothetical protein